MSLYEIATFTFVAALLVISPGPNGVLIARTVPISGRAAGFANVFGFVAAFYLHGALSVIGISVILVQSATAFTIVKYLGAAYLCWIGIKALLDSFQSNKKIAKGTAARKATIISAFFEGLLTNALNPKVSMFYLAAFPQFITVGETTVMSSFLLVSIHSILNAIWFGAMVMLLASLSKVASNEIFQRYLKRITGVVFIGFGLKLASYKPHI